MRFNDATTAVVSKSLVLHSIVQLKVAFAGRCGDTIHVGCLLVRYYGGGLVNRTHYMYKNLHIYQFLRAIFGPIYYGPPKTYANGSAKFKSFFSNISL